MVSRIFLTALLIALFYSCSSTDQKQQSKQIFRYNESKGISTLDPAFARNQILIWPVTQLFNGLLEMDDSLHLKPSIAKKWEVSDDGLVYTFYLRQDVYFHDSEVFPSGRGRKVNANDVVYSFNRILNPKVASPGAWIFNDVDSLNGFHAVNDSTVEIKLKRKFSAFPNLLSMPYSFIVPKEAIDFYGDDFRSHPVGTGPFMFKVWREGEKLVFVRNPKYFEKDSAGRQLPYLDAIAITFITDKQSEFLEFAKGNIDFLSGVQTSYRNELLTRSGKLNPKYTARFNMEVMPYLNTEYLGCNIDPVKAKESPLLNKNIRLAINYGFDRAKMLKYLRNNLGTPAYWGFIPKGMPGFTENGPAYSYNPDLARKYLADAGYPNGVALPEITLTSASDYLDLCEFIQHELSQIGIRLNIEVSNGAAFRELIANSKAQMFRASWLADYADAGNYLSLFYSQNFTPKGPNYTHYKNTRFDKLYENSMAQTNEQERITIYQEMNRMIVEEAPIIPLYYDMVVRFFPKNIKGFKGNPINLLKLKTVYKTIDK